MKKIILFSLSIVIFCTAVSCVPYRSLNNADTISQLAGNKFMKNLSKAIIANIQSLGVSEDNSNINHKINLGTKLSAVLPADLMGGFNNILSKQYQIPLNKLEAGNATWNTVRDVIAFVANNGKGFNFYKQ